MRSFHGGDIEFKCLSVRIFGIAVVSNGPAEPSFKIDELRLHAQKIPGLERQETSEDGKPWRGADKSC